MNSPSPLKLISGIPGITQRVTYSYRGFTIERAYRTHDGRNKIHNGYNWRVAWSETGFTEAPTRSRAKAMVDEHIRAVESQETAVHRPAELRARAELAMAAAEGRPLDDLAVAGAAWTVRADDYDRLATAARGLRAACRDRLTPGHYAQLDNECRAVDAALSPRT